MHSILKSQNSCFLSFFLRNYYGSFSSKNLIDIAKNNLEITKILPMTELMKQSANNRNENCIFKKI